MSQVAHIPTVEKAELTIEQELDQALVKANLTDEVIQHLIETAMAVAKPIESEEQYKEVKKVESDIKQVRLIGEKNLNVIDRRRIDRNKYEMTKVQELRAKIHEPEVLLGSVLGPWMTKKKEEAEAEQRAIEQENEGRKAAVHALGFVFHPGPPEHRYILGDMTVGITQVINVEHDVWTNTYNDMRMKSEEVNAAKEEQEAMEAAMAAAAQKQKEEQDAKEKELAVREAEMVRREAEARKSVESIRLMELKALGVDGDMYYQQHFIGESVQPPLAEYEDGEWPSVIERVKEVVGRMEERDVRINAEREREVLIKERIEKLKAAGWEDTVDRKGLMLNTESGDVGATSYVWFKGSQDGVYNLTSEQIDGMVQRGNAELARRQEAEKERIRQDERDRIEKENLLKSQQAEKAEADRVAKMGDKEKWTEWTTTIKSTAPTMSTKEGKKDVENILSMIK